MYCSDCRRDIPDGSLACPHCRSVKLVRSSAAASGRRPEHRPFNWHEKSAFARYGLFIALAILVAFNLLTGYHFIKEKLGSGKQGPATSAVSATDIPAASGDAAPLNPPADKEVNAQVQVIEREARRWEKIESALPAEKVGAAPETPAKGSMPPAVRDNVVPVTPKVSVPPPASLARRHEIQGIAEFNKGNYSVALEIFQQALQKEPADKNLKKDVALCYNKIGWANIKKGEYWDAIGNFKEAISYNQDEPSFFLGLGLAYYQMKNYDSAVVDLGRAAKMASNDPMPHQLLGQIYYQQDNIDLALEHWGKALEINPGDTVTRARIAKAKREHAVQKDFNRDLTAHFTIRHEGGERTEIGRKVLRILEDAYGRMGRELSYYPDTDIVVILYSNQQFRDVTMSPGWAGGVFDGKIRIPVGNISEDDPQLEKVVRHEYTHALIHSVTTRIPTWLNEGLARHFESRTDGASEKKILREIARKGGLAPLSSLEGSFVIFSKDQAWLAYAESLSAVAYLVERYGLYDIKRVIDELAKGVDMRAALQNVLFISYEDFQENWKKSLDE